MPDGTPKPGSGRNAGAKPVGDFLLGHEQHLLERFATDLGKPVTAGSDTRQCLQFGSVYNELQMPCESAAELKDAIMQGAYQLHVSDSLPIKVKASVMLKKLMKEIIRLQSPSAVI
ncbi:PHP-associated domain-containing protein [Paenibacillus lautus]|nr:PHP-associated domain-containing protein [Paenibacillus lautus]MEC0202121.1 PHP-associated domain-containing protein [Paenibacillus lautus]